MRVGRLSGQEVVTETRGYGATQRRNIERERGQSDRDDWRAVVLRVGWRSLLVRVLSRCKSGRDGTLKLVRSRE